MDGKLAVPDWTQCEAPYPSGVEGKTIRCCWEGGLLATIGFRVSALLCSFRSRWLDQRERTADAQDRDNIPLETWCWRALANCRQQRSMLNSIVNQPINTTDSPESRSHSPPTSKRREGKEREGDGGEGKGLGWRLEYDTVCKELGAEAGHLKICSWAITISWYCNRGIMVACLVCIVCREGGRDKEERNELIRI